MNIPSTFNFTAKDHDGDQMSKFVDGTGNFIETIVHHLLPVDSVHQESNGVLPAIQALVKVLIVPHDGYLCRRDILQLRMVQSECVETLVSHPEPGSLFPSPYPPNGKGDLLSLLQSSPGALICKPSLCEAHGIGAFDLLDKDLYNRLSFDWVLPIKPPTRTVAVVGGRPLFDSTTCSYGSEGPFNAARALGISVIVLDRPGHFMQRPEYSHLCDGFIAVDMTIDDRLPDRLAEAVRGLKIDGIITFSDEYVITTAKAAALLGLETEPVESIVTAHYKDATRRALDAPNLQSLRVESSEDLDSERFSSVIEGLKYPLVVKPCRGAASRGVKKVRGLSELRQALTQLERDGLSKYGMLIETYISGPEIDANIALWNGEVLFIEITDDFPCTADASDATVADSFGETVMVSPTSLPQQEQELLKKSLHQSLLKVGFRNGVFHVEARIRDSEMEYQDVDGIVDLAKRDAASPGLPEVYLIEINARPPGLDCAFSTLHAYGVDLCALQLLQCVKDGGRFAAMCKPFLFETQYWSANCLIPIHRHNITVPEGFCDKVLARMPDAAPFVYRAELFREPGAVVSPPLGIEFLAYFLVFSRTDRRDVLQIYYRLMQTCRDVLDGK
ncbi:carnosine synthase 1 [Fusarium beomiforme]|uniref:Carnosine synthase 1 n=1 Tax=Fusarium beomiforme TaxID=44412 RepID=A0A9P5E3L9_9HYPO|nr:carnosine synthase 1 [Fusarium beomiforme]